MGLVRATIPSGAIYQRYGPRDREGNNTLGVYFSLGLAMWVRAHEPLQPKNFQPENLGGPECE